ncbi:hypothetical protein GGER_08680 [Serratia rubidaea]
MRQFAPLIPLVVLLSACSSKPENTTQPPQGRAVQGGFLLEADHVNPMLSGDYAYNASAQRFIDKMVREHGLIASSCMMFSRRPSDWTG